MSESSVEADPKTTVSKRTIRELKKLSASTDGPKLGCTRSATRAEAVQSVIDGPKDPKNDAEEAMV